MWHPRRKALDGRGTGRAGGAGVTQDRSGACAVARRGGNEQRSSETTHAGSLSGVSCTDDRIATYLLTGALPTRLSGDRSDVQCEPVPPPDPASAASAAAAK